MLHPRNLAELVSEAGACFSSDTARYDTENADVYIDPDDNGIQSRLN